MKEFYAKLHGKNFHDHMKKCQKEIDKIIPNNKPINKTMVKITAKVLLNFSLRLKKSTIGLPISEITAAIAMYTMTD